MTNSHLPEGEVAVPTLSSSDYEADRGFIDRCSPCIGFTPGFRMSRCPTSPVARARGARAGPRKAGRCSGFCALKP